jgi:hypothetical protein
VLAAGKLARLAVWLSGWLAGSYLLVAGRVMYCLLASCWLVALPMRLKLFRAEHFESLLYSRLWVFKGTGGHLSLGARPRRSPITGRASVSVDCSILLISVPCNWACANFVLCSARSGPCSVRPCLFQLFYAARAAVRAPFVPASSSSSVLRAQRSVLRSSLPLSSLLRAQRSVLRSSPPLAFVLFCSVPFHSFRLFFSKEVSLSIDFLAAGPLTRTRHRAAAWVSFWTNLKEARAEER